MDTVHPPKGNVLLQFLEFPKIPLIVLLIETQRKIIFTPQELKLKLLLRKFQEKLNLIIIWFYLGILKKRF